MSDLARNWLNVVVILIVVFSFAALLSWIERRLLGVWQDRYGPNRVGPFGVLQVVADAIKLLTKEDWVPPFADKAVFVLAPAVIFITHDVGEAVFIANRVVALSKGRVLEEIAVDLPRPRSWDALNDDARFKELSGRVLQLVRSA